MAYEELKLLSGSYLYEEHSLSCHKLDLPSYFETSSIYPKIYWKDRFSNLERIGLGALISLRDVPEFHPHNTSKLQFFGIKSSWKPHPYDVTWKDLPRAYFFLPEIEILQTPHQTHFVIRSFKGAQEPEPLLSSPLFQRCSSNVLQRRDSPEYTQWEKNILSALELIQNKTLEKIVLARRTTLHCKNRLSPLLTLASLMKNAQSTTLFAFQITEDKIFLGATPEKLYERCGQKLKSEALAGTQLSREPRSLLENAKNYHEFSAVKKFLSQSLASMGCSFTWEKEKTLSTGDIEHIYSRVEATIPPNLSDKDLITILHPTPALGSYPQQRAHEYISSLEDFDRGWYASPMGWIGSYQSNIALAIRSGLIDKDHLHLFSGVGIVEGSDPQQEWLELENKIAPFLQSCS